MKIHTIKMSFWCIILDNMQPFHRFFPYVFVQHIIKNGTSIMLFLDWMSAMEPLPVIVGYMCLRYKTKDGSSIIVF